MLIMYSSNILLINEIKLIFLIEPNEIIYLINQFVLKLDS